MRSHGVIARRRIASGGGGPSFSGEVYYVNTAASSGGDGTTNGTSGSDRAFASLNEAINDSAVSSDLSTSAVQINCTGTSADTLSIEQNDWNNLTTSAVNYLEIRGDNDTGKWSTSHYRIEVTNTDAIYNNKPGHVRIYDLQIKLNVTNGSNYTAYRLATANVGAGLSDCDCRFVRCIANLNRTGGGRPTGFQDSVFAVDGTIVRENCIAFDSGTGGIGYIAANSDVANDSCLADCTWYGFGDPQSCRNCVAVGTPAAGGFLGVTGSGTSHSYNASEDGTAPGSNSEDSQDFADTFVDAANGDYHLESDDDQLKGLGSTDLTTDIDGETRGTPDDIGPDDQQ